MSTEQSVDPELVEETKQQIRNLVREIAQLSKSELSPLEYYDAMLNRVVAALAAVGGAIWTLSEAGQLELGYQINLRDTRLAESSENQARHGQLLRKVLTSGQGMLVAPHSGAGSEEEGSNPTDYLLVLGPLKTDQETKGIIEVFQRPGASANVQRGYLRFLLQMCELAGDFLKTRQLRHFTSRQVLWSQLENFTRLAHRSLDPRATAYTIANEGRRLLDCDRVSVGICKGKKCVIEAVSGQDTFDKRSNTVSLLGRLATAVTATGEPVWYTGDTTYMAPQVEEAVQAYVDESHSKTVAIIPLKRPDESPDEESEPAPVIGALIVEQIEDSRPKEGLPQRIEVVSDHSSTALANALEHNNLFLMPLWRTLGKAQWVLRARTLPKTLAILGAIAAVIGVLTFWPADFELQGKGTLQPAERREVFAGTDGTITKVLVKHGEMVKKDDVLVEMRNSELESSLEELMGKRNSAFEQWKSKERALPDAKKKSIADEVRLRGEMQEAKKFYESYSKQYEILEQKKKLLKVVSPINGQVIDPFRLEEVLMSRSVKQGQVLMTVADPGRDWELEIHMPEDRMGHVGHARQDIQKQDPKKDLSVTYILATDPGKKLVGHVKEVHASAEVHGDEGNTVMVRVAVDKNDFPDRRPGATVTAKIYCGRASLGFVLFHDVIAFVQTKILFRL